MPYENVAAFIAKLREREATAALALEFCILTAARSGEVLGAQWSEIDLDKKIWTVPASRMKGGREHRVPLSDPTIELLRALPIEKNNSFMFIGGKSGAGLSNMALLQTLKRMKRADLTAHGFRSTFRD